MGSNMRPACSSPMRSTKSSIKLHVLALSGKDGRELLFGCLKHAERRIERAIYDLYVLQSQLPECPAQAL